MAKTHLKPGWLKKDLARTRLHFARRELLDVEATLREFDGFMQRLKDNRDLAIARKKMLLEEIQKLEAE